MTNNRSIDETLVRIVPDRAASSALVREAKKVKRAITDIGLSGDRALDRRLASSAKVASKSVQKLTNDLKQVKRTIDDFPDDLGVDPLFGPGGDTGRRRQAGPLRNIGRAARVNLPAVPIGAFSTEQVARGVEGLGFLSDSISDLNLKSGVAAAGVAAVGIAITALLIDTKRVADEARASTSSFFSEEQEFNKRVAESTEDVIQSDLDRVQADLAVAKQNRLLASQVSLGLQQAVAEQGLLAQATTEAAIATGLGAQEIAVAREESQKWTDTVDQLEAAERALIRALESDEVATRSMQQAEDELAQVRQQFVDSQIRDQVNLLKQFSTAQDTSGVDRLIEKSIADREIIGRTLETLEQGTPLFDELNSEFTRLSSTISTLSLIIRPEVAAREAEATALEAAKDKLLSFLSPLQNFGKTLQDLAGNVEEVKKAGQAIEKLRQQSADRISQIEARRAESERQAAQDRNNSIADAEQDAANARADLQLDREEAEREHQQNINRIINRANASIANAIQDRNAIALVAAEEQRDRDLAEERENADKRNRELTRQGREIERSLRQQTQIIQRRYRQQLETATIAANQAIQVENQRYQAELRLKTQALQALLQTDAAGESRRITIAANGAQQKIRLEGQYWQASINLVQQAISAISGAGQAAAGRPLTDDDLTSRPSDRGGRRTIPIFHDGGVVTRTGLAMVQRGEVIRNPARGQGNGGTITLNLAGATREVTRQQAMQVFGEALDTLGVA